MPHDLIREAKEIALYKKWFILCPKNWEKLKNINDLRWKSFPFDGNHAHLIPKTQGIYSFVIYPKFTNHPQRYLCYIGKTNRTLRERYVEYLNESKSKKGRPKIVSLLNLWKGYLEFCYIEEKRDLLNLEKTLLEAFIPPCNEDLPANVSRPIRAFN